MAIWTITCRDNGSKFQCFDIKAVDKQTAIKEGLKKARKKANGDITTWDCKLKKVI